jgi:hypothetical protein
LQSFWPPLPGWISSWHSFRSAWLSGIPCLLSLPNGTLK